MKSVFFPITDGGVFVRWGRKDCPGNNTELVYSGNALPISNEKKIKKTEQ